MHPSAQPRALLRRSVCYVYACARCESPVVQMRVPLLSVRAMRFKIAANKFKQGTFPAFPQSTSLSVFQARLARLEMPHPPLDRLTSRHTNPLSLTYSRHVWPAWKCASYVDGPSHPGTPTPSYRHVRPAWTPLYQPTQAH